MSQKSSLFIVLTAVIFLVGLGVGGYLLTRKPINSSTQPEPKNLTVFSKPFTKKSDSGFNTLNDPIADEGTVWETRNIYLLNLQIDIPSNWTLNEANLKQDCADYLVRSNDDNALLYLKPTCKTSDNKIPDPPKNTIVLKDYGSLTLGIEAKLFYGGLDAEKSKYLKTSDQIISSIKKL